VRRSSQALVEFALAMVVFMLLVLGTFDLARAHLSYTVVANAAREASRYGAAHVGEANWVTAAAQAGTRLAVGLDASALSWDRIEATTIGTLPYITVSATYRFQSLTPLVGALLGNPITIRVDTSAPVG
jgi:Flp pilus assembly protein TadG